MPDIGAWESPRPPRHAQPAPVGKPAVAAPPHHRSQRFDHPMARFRLRALLPDAIYHLWAGIPPRPERSEHLKMAKEATAKNPAPATTPAPAPAATKAETAAGRKKADHFYIDASGAVVETQEAAAGIGYRDAATKAEVKFPIPGAQAGSVLTMLAVFGAKTLATNTASANRNSTTGPTGTDIDAIKARFAELKDGQWDVSEGRGGGPKVDVAVLATVMAEFGKAKGKSTTAAEYEKKLTDDLPFRRTVMQVTAIRDEYRKRAGVAAPAIDDVL